MLLVNLLPWREQSRKQQNLYFLSMLLIIAITGLIIASVIYHVLQHRLKTQQQHNQYLSEQIQSFQLPAQAAHIQKNYQQQLEQLQLQQQSTQSYQQFLDKLAIIAQSLPNHCHLTQLQKTPEHWLLQGAAKQSNLITQFVNQLSQQQHFNAVTLEKITQADASHPATFTIQIDINHENKSA